MWLVHYQFQMKFLFFVGNDVFKLARIDVVSIDELLVLVRFGAIFILYFENQYGIIFHQEIIFDFHIGNLDDLSRVRINVIKVEIAMVVDVQVTVVVAIDLVICS